MASYEPSKSTAKAKKVNKFWYLHITRAGEITRLTAMQTSDCFWILQDCEPTWESIEIIKTMLHCIVKCESVYSLWLLENGVFMALIYLKTLGFASGFTL